jgi:uncharacterized protein YunC (DUF1805 family)
MQINTKTFQTANGLLEGVQVKWSEFNILLVTGPKGFLACPAVDIDVCQRFNVAAALVESSPENPIGTLERFNNRKISKVNQKGETIGIKKGMNVDDALALIA